MEWCTYQPFQCVSNSKKLSVDEGLKLDKCSGLLNNKNRQNTCEEPSKSKRFKKAIQLKEKTLRTEGITRKGTVDHGQIGHASDKPPWCDFNYDIILENFS